MTRFTPALAAEVVALLASGSSIKKAADAVGFSDRALYYHRERYPEMDEAMSRAADGAPGRTDPELIDRAVQLIDAGATIRSAMSQTGIPPVTMFKLRRRYPLLDEAMARAESRYRARLDAPEKIGRAIELLNGGRSISAAARGAGIGRSTLYRYRGRVPELDQAMRLVEERRGEFS